MNASLNSTGHHKAGLWGSLSSFRNMLAVIFLFTACSDISATKPPVLVRAVDGELAFPGAVGFGAASKGGRGGKIISVTTLSDSGVGSLRECIDATGPRVCVFRIAGVIRYTAKPPIVRNPYLTIAGQTAPGGGITLAHSGGENGYTPLIIKNTHDVIVRHIRVRPDRNGMDREAEDAFTIENSTNVILDHVSGSWARDEVVNAYGDNDKITISYSIFAQGIPRHDKCALLGSDPSGPQNLSFIGNICAHNGDRNPDINFAPGSCVEIINNLLYNAQSQFAEVWESYGGSPVAIVGNVFRKGPNTADHAVGIDLERIGSTGRAQIYHYDNRFDGHFVHRTPLLDEVSVEQSICPLTLQPVPADTAYANALAASGAFPRDAFDFMIIDQIKSQTGKIVKMAGKLAPIAKAQGYPDQDGDGMDDKWEAGNGANPAKSDSWEIEATSGLAYFDAFLDYRHKMLLGS